MRIRGDTGPVQAEGGAEMFGAIRPNQAKGQYICHYRNPPEETLPAIQSGESTMRTIG